LHILFPHVRLIYIHPSIHQPDNIHIYHIRKTICIPAGSEKQGITEATLRNRGIVSVTRVTDVLREGEHMHMYKGRRLKISSVVAIRRALVSGSRIRSCGIVVQASAAAAEEKVKNLNTKLKRSKEGSRNTELFSPKDQANQLFCSPFSTSRGELSSSLFCSARISCLARSCSASPVLATVCVLLSVTGRRKKPRISPMAAMHV
jgi:hypothetical protein